MCLARTTIRRPTVNMKHRTPSRKKTDRGKAVEPVEIKDGRDKDKLGGYVGLKQTEHVPEAGEAPHAPVDPEENKKGQLNGNQEGQDGQYFVDPLRGQEEFEPEQIGHQMGRDYGGRISDEHAIKIAVP